MTGTFAYKTMDHIMPFIQLYQRSDIYQKPSYFHSLFYKSYLDYLDTPSV